MQQLTLLDPLPPPWQLDPLTRARGFAGIRAARAALHKEKPVLPTRDRRTTRTATTPPKQQVATVLRDTARDLRRGVDTTMIARRLDNLAAAIDPAVVA